MSLYKHGLFPFSNFLSGFDRLSIPLRLAKGKKLFDCMYKHFVNPLLIFICKSLNDYKNFASQNTAYDRYYITDGFEVNTTDENSSFMSISLDKNVSVEFIIRLVFLFSNPFYDVVIYSNTNFYDKNICDKILEDFSGINIIDNVLAVSREYVALNGFDFKIDIKKVEHKDPLIMAEKLSQAMSEIPVEQEYFIEAIKELIPASFYVLDNDFDQNEKEILKIFKDINANLEYQDRKTNVLWMKPNTSNPAIVFNYESLQDYTFVVKRIDGMNFYIYM